MEPRLHELTIKGLKAKREQGIDLRYMQEDNAEIGVMLEKVHPSPYELTQMLMNARKSGKCIIAILYTRLDENIMEYPFSWTERDMNINIDFRGYFGLRLNRHENKGKKFLIFPPSLTAGR